MITDNIQIKHFDGRSLSIRLNGHLNHFMLNSVYPSASVPRASCLSENKHYSSRSCHGTRQSSFKEFLLYFILQLYHLFYLCSSFHRHNDMWFYCYNVLLFSTRSLKFCCWYRSSSVSCNCQKVGSNDSNCCIWLWSIDTWQTVRWVHVQVARYIKEKQHHQFIISHCFYWYV